MMDEMKAAVTAYTTKQVDFRFRGRTLSLSLSHALFSSADVDMGTRFLLRVLSRLWDEDMAGLPAALSAALPALKGALPRTILDAGCGVGSIGVAVAAALTAAGVSDLRVRAQDRDELARAFTAENARANGIGADILAAYAEPLLAGPAGARWDLILSNVPAKAGDPVLADFFARSSALLAIGGRALVVVVNPLAAAVRTWIVEAGAAILSEEAGAEHTVFAYGRTEAQESEPILPAGPPDHLSTVHAESFSVPGPAYVRTTGDFELEGTKYRIEALHGVPDFDEPSRPVVLAAKLLVRLGVPVGSSSVLVHEPDQGHFPAWLAYRTAAASSPPRFTLVGRNVLALAAALKNTSATEVSLSSQASATAAVDLGIAAERIAAASGPFDLIVSFPEAVPRVDRATDSWTGVGKLLANGGLFLFAQASTAAERFDRRKPRGFSRIGDLKRDGFRALAYRKSPD